MSSFRAIFFDIGDTLVFDHPPLPKRLQIAMQECGFEHTADGFAQAYRAGEDHALSLYVEGVPWEDPNLLRESASRIFDILGLPQATDQDWQRLMQSFLSVPFSRRPHAGAKTLLESLQNAGYRLGVISDWDNTLPSLLAEWGLAPYFGAVTASCEVGVTKPSPALFAEALRRLDVPPRECLHVGDWYSLDVVGARRAGMETILFDHAGRTPDADCARVETFEDLERILTCPRNHNQLP